jgi:hypothetical protein
MNENTLEINTEQQSCTHVFCGILALKLTYRVVQLKNKCSGCYTMLLGKCRYLQEHVAHAILRNGRHHGDHSCSILFEVRFDVLQFSALPLICGS